jgi:nucleoid-associated protein YgaU
LQDRQPAAPEPEHINRNIKATRARIQGGIQRRRCCATEQVKQIKSLNPLRKYFISNQVVTTVATSGEKTYLVKGGDTLNLIASSQLGSAAKYVQIQKRNNLPNPNLILVGQHLMIPVL